VPPSTVHSPLVGEPIPSGNLPDSN
jgi:hypothetical protein